VAGSRDNLPPSKPAPILALRLTVAGGRLFSKLYACVRVCARACVYMFFKLPPATKPRKPAPVLVSSGGRFAFQPATSPPPKN
jgi:hypothetical protein